MVSCVPGYKVSLHDKSVPKTSVQGWEEGLQKYIMSLKDPSLHGGKPYTSRYIGSLVRSGVGHRV